MGEMFFCTGYIENSVGYIEEILLYRNNVSYRMKLSLQKLNSPRYLGVFIVNKVFPQDFIFY